MKLITILLSVITYSNLFSQVNQIYDSINKVDTHGIKQGKWIEYDNESKAPKSVNYYNDGALNGLCTSFFRNGKIATQINFENGKKNGVCKYFFDNGNISGIFIMENDSILWHAIYHLDGMIDQEYIYKNYLPYIGITYKEGKFSEEGMIK